MFVIIKTKVQILY